MSRHQDNTNKEVPVKEIKKKLVHKVMWKGKKNLAIGICDEALDIAGKELGCEPLEALERAVDNVKPLLEVKSRRVGGATYQVPVEVTHLRGIQLTVRWLVDFARSGKGTSMAERLSREIIQAARGQGAAVDKKESIHKMAKANKAFAHYSY